MKKRFIAFILALIFAASVFIIKTAADAGDYAGDDDYGDYGGWDDDYDNDWDYDNDYDYGGNGTPRGKGRSRELTIGETILVQLISLGCIAVTAVMIVKAVKEDRKNRKKRNQKEPISKSVIIFILIVILAFIIGSNIQGILYAVWNNTGGMFSYAEYGTTYGIKSFNGNYRTEAVVPDVHNGREVALIESSAFGKHSSLKKVTLGNNIKIIQFGALRDCSKLESITIPQGLTTVGASAFSGCKNLKTVYYTGTSSQWKEISISSDNDPLLNAHIICEYRYGDFDPDGSRGKNMTALFVVIAALTVIITAGITLIIVRKIAPELNDFGTKKKQPVNVGDRSTPQSRLKPMSEYKKIDPDFSETDMKAKVSEIYVNMQKNWMNKDFSPMRPYFTAPLYAQFERQLNQKIEQGVTPHIDRISVRNVTLRGFMQSDDGLDHIIIKLETRITVYTVEDATGRIVSGSRSREKLMTYEWDVTRTTGMKTDKNDTGKETVCPSCGAPVDINASAKCSHCGSFIKSSGHDWAVSSITGLSQLTI